MSEMILTPVMTSNTTPSGNVIYDHYNGHNFPTGEGYGYGDKQYYAFDKANNTCCCINQEGIANAWIGYEFSEPVKANKLVARLGNFSATDSFVVKAQYYDGTDWVDAADPVTVSGLSDGNSEEFVFNFTKAYTSTKFRLITPTTKTSGTNLLVVEFHLYAPESDTHLKSSGSTEAIRDWLNASLYNKEEIDDLFIQNNQAGLIPYDLMITGDQPDQMIKLVGQTSGKTYNICLAAILGDKYCYHGLLWFGQGEDVKIFDSDSSEELLEHTLSERMDEIELPEYMPYTYLEYIEVGDTSGPYIDTGISMSTLNGCEVKFKYNGNNADNRALFGTYLPYYDSLIENYRGYIGWRIGNVGFSQLTATKIPLDTKVHVAKADTSDILMDSINGGVPDWSRVPSGQNVYIFNEGGNRHSPTNNARIYYVKMYKDNVLSYHLIPAKRKSDNAIGMHDIINDVFYSNSGSGSFIAGPNKQS